jgi:hypothetical protein
MYFKSFDSKIDINEILNLKNNLKNNLKIMKLIICKYDNRLLAIDNDKYVIICDLITTDEIGRLSHTK